MRHVLIVRLGELVLKGDNRGRFEKTLLQQVKSMVELVPGVRIETAFGRIYLFAAEEATIALLGESLQNLFGIHSLSPAVVVENELSEIASIACLLVNKAVKSELGVTFKVESKRSNKSFPLTAVQLSAHIGGRLLESCSQLKVDLHNPQWTLCIEMQSKHSFVYLKAHTIDAVGGFPLGASGHALALLSGGIDSPVAAWLAMRRGLQLELIHFHSYPYTSEQARDKVIRLAKRLATYGGSLKLHMVPFTEVQEYIRRKVQDRLWVTVMRRAMLRIAEQVAERASLQALVTGDSLGQVASQTLGSLRVMEEVTTMPVIRPLITMDKQEIVRLAAQIETLSISELPFDDCCSLFVPEHPTTNPNLKVVVESERRSRKLEALLAQTIDRVEMLEITARTNSSNQPLHPLL
jgi:thiamine biosynthesis protein ThiI